MLPSQTSHLASLHKLERDKLKFEYDTGSQPIDQNYRYLLLKLKIL